MVFDAILREKAAGEFEGGHYGDQARMAKKKGEPVRSFKPKGGESHDDVLKRALDFIKQQGAKYLPIEKVGKSK